MRRLNNSNRIVAFVLNELVGEQVSDQVGLVEMRTGRRSIPKLFISFSPGFSPVLC